MQDRHNVSGRHENNWEEGKWNSMHIPMIQKNGSP